MTDQWVAVAARLYQGVVQTSLVAYKERGAWQLSRPLGSLLAWSVTMLCAAVNYDGPIELIPVPSSAHRIRERGEDVTLRLARDAAATLRRIGVSARVHARLTLTRHVVDQSGLHRHERHDNLNQSMNAISSAGAPWIVVDDIITTGATLTESIRALGSGGLGAATVAATPLRRGL